MGWLNTVDSVGQADFCVSAGERELTRAGSGEETLVRRVGEEVFSLIVIGSSLTGWETGRLMGEGEEKGADKN